MQIRIFYSGGFFLYIHNKKNDTFASTKESNKNTNKKAKFVTYLLR